MLSGSPERDPSRTPDPIRGKRAVYLKKTYPPRQERPHTRRMCSEPASRISHASIGPHRLIGLFLTRLYAHLIRLNTSGQRYAPSDIAHMVVSAEAMVQAFVRSLAAAQLKSAGYHDAACAMCMPPGLHTPLTVQAHADPVRTDQLIERITSAIADFEKADALASLLARIIFCALAYLMHDAETETTHILLEAESMSLPKRPADRILPPWPPPLRRPFFFSRELIVPLP